MCNKTHVLVGVIIDQQIKVPGATHTHGYVRMCSGRLVSSTWPSDD